MNVNIFFYWFKQLLLLLLSFFFVSFGIHILIQSYHLTNPLEFIMTFFSSSLMILISMVGIIYPLIQVYIAWRKKMTIPD